MGTNRISVVLDIDVDQIPDEGRWNQGLVAHMLGSALLRVARRRRMDGLGIETTKFLAENGIAIVGLTRAPTVRH